MNECFLLTVWKKKKKKYFPHFDAQNLPKIQDEKKYKQLNFIKALLDY